MNNVISVLCPTRGREKVIAANIRLLLEQAAHPERVEVLLAIDEDDTNDYAETWRLFGKRDGKPMPWKLFREPRWGYAKLCNYYNRLVREATGRWCLLWNDDVFMVTKHWDLAFDAATQDIAVGITEANHGRSPCTFPAFTKTYADVLGHVSLNPHNDTWIEVVGAAAGILVQLPVLMVHTFIEDKTAFEGKEEGRLEQTSASFDSPEMAKLRKEDVQRIKEYLGK